MKTDRRTVEARRSEILRQVRENGEIRVEELAEQHRVSLMTIRRDLQVLQRDQLLERTYGKALSIAQADKKKRESRNIQLYRECISKYAARLVEDGDKLFINGSRTALGLLKYTGDKKIIVQTNNGWAVGEKYPGNVELTLIGGILTDRIMIGEYVMQNLLGMSADKTFIGCAAVYEDGEFSYNIPTEIGINEIMIARTRGELYVCADHSKLHRREEQANAYGSCRYSRQVNLITDSLADPEIISSLRTAGVNVIVVPAEA